MTNDLYKKMILTLPDSFFNRWQWKAGDQYLYRSTGKKYYIKNIDCFKERHDQKEFFGECVPLPSQKQLQKLCMTQINCSPQDLLRFFEAWLYEDEIRPVVDFEDFDDLWLQYTVWVCLRQRWDGEKWI